MAVLPVADFVVSAEERGLSLRVDGENIKLIGPDALRTEKVLRYMRSQKPTLLEFLRSRDGLWEESPSATASAPSAGQQDAETDAAALGAEVERELRERWVQRGPLVEGRVIRFDLGDLYRAACAGCVPAVAFRQQQRAGFGTPNARAFVLSAVARLRSKRGIVEAKGVDAFMDATRPEWLGLAAIWEWWSELPTEGQEHSHERTATECPTALPASA